MELAEVQDLLTRIKGCTFASLDAETAPRPGIRQVTLGARVLLFTNKNSSGYENMVRRRLAEAGKDPDTFRLGDLPWGERVPNTPLIVNNGRYYLQTIVLEPGTSDYWIGRHKVNPEDVGIRKRQTDQGLPPGREVIVSTYALANITRIALLGEERQSKPKRGLLRLPI